MWPVQLQVLVAVHRQEPHSDVSLEQSQRQGHQSVQENGGQTDQDCAKSQKRDSFLRQSRQRTRVGRLWKHEWRS